MVLLETRQWAMAQFANVDLGDRRRSKKIDPIGGGHG